MQTTFDQLLSLYSATCALHGYNEQLMLICQLLKEHTNDADDAKKQRLMQALKQNQQFVNPAEFIFML